MDIARQLQIYYTHRCPYSEVQLGQLRLGEQATMDNMKSENHDSCSTSVINDQPPSDQVDVDQIYQSEEAKSCLKD